MGGMGASFLGFSATMASVVISKEATEQHSGERSAPPWWGVDDARRHQVFVDAGLGVEALEAVVLVGSTLARNGSEKQFSPDFGHVKPPATTCHISWKPISLQASTAR